MRTQDQSNAQELFGQWKGEHLQLDKSALELSRWLHEQSKLRTSQFRDAVARIAELNQKLTVHFAKEKEIVRQLIDQQGSASVELKAVQRQSEHDHAIISSRIKHLIDRMQEGESDCDAWKTGVNELNLILDVLEQHEEQESESVGWLLPVACTTPQGNVE